MRALRLLRFILLGSFSDALLVAGFAVLRAFPVLFGCVQGQGLDFGCSPSAPPQPWKGYPKIKKKP